MPLFVLLFFCSEARASTPLGTMTTTIAFLVVLLLLPVLVLLWATESREQRARRQRRNGWSQQRIADHLGCSRTTVRRLLAA
jgi:AraC-like DNA-binding protein